MKKYAKTTVEGTRDWLFSECENRRQIMEELRLLFIEKGYRQVSTPGFEYFDVFNESKMHFPSDTTFKLFDDKGRVLVTRPDSTIPIARLVATKMKDLKNPVRIFYSQPVFRKNPNLSGFSNEIMQTGLELIGDSSFSSDIELLNIAASSLEIGSKDIYRLEIGHIGIYKVLMENLNVDEQEAAIIRSFINVKNYSALSDRLSRHSDNPYCDIIKELPRLFGKEEVFYKAEKLFSGKDERLPEMLGYLHDVYEKMSDDGYKEHMLVDLGLVNQADYYSSLVYKGYISNIGEPVISGGRYNDLLKEFGLDAPATGFAINVDRIAIERLNKKKEHVKRPLRLALTKGRLEDETIELFDKIGIDTKPFKEKGRKLTIKLESPELEIVFAKANDVITYVEHGVCDLGVVGLDTILEKEGTFYELLDLKFGACKFSLAGPDDKDFYDGFDTKRIATKYPNVASRFFEEKGMDIKIIKIDGSVELAPILDLADAIVDIVSTGTTLRENGLSIIEDIKHISARLIANITSMKLKKNEIDFLIERINDEIN